MKYLILLLALTGCASLSPQDARLRNQLQADATQRVTAFNKRYHADITTPTIVLQNIPGFYGETVPGEIIINPVLCRQRLRGCFNDTVPHELAHAELLQSNRQRGHWAFGRFYLDHGKAWCDTMRAFGGNPQKHGYCQR